MRIEGMAIVLGLAACTPTPLPGVTVNDAYGNDAYVVDMGAVVVYPDMGTDTGVLDAPDTNVDMNLPDMNLPDMNVPDTGTGSAIVLDGVLDDAFWTANPSNPPLDDMMVALDPFTGEALSRLVYGRDARYLYLGIEGTLNVGDAIVIYVDVNPGSGSGVMLMGSGLGDTSNYVNSVASLMITGNALFQPDFLWGTSTLPGSGSSVVSSPALGWRRLQQTGAFGTLSAGTRSVCSSTGCETEIQWSTLGVPSTNSVAIVARLGRPNVAFASNQLFPTTDTGAPEMISATIPVAP
jgi:hypothetical protein